MSRPKPGQWFTTNQVAEIAKVSLRQLQWWDEKRITPVRHERHRRIWDHADVLRVLVIAEFRRKRISVQRIRRAIRLMEKFPLAVMTENFILFGNAVSFQPNSEAVISIITRSNHPIFVVDLAALRDRLYVHQRRAA